MKSITFHRLAEPFPMLPDEELNALADDIKLNGLKLPICLYEGTVLDGRNRYRACEIAGVEPRFETYTGTDPLAHVISLNLARRHLDESQRAMVAGKLANMPVGRNWANSANLHDNKTSLEQAAKLLNVSRRSVATAKTILRDAPERVAEIEQGKATVNEVVRDVKRRQRREAEAAALNKSTGRNWTVTSDQVIPGCVAIITDPPYGILDEVWEPKELESFTRKWLRRCDESTADFILSFWSQENMWDGRGWFDEALAAFEFQHLLVWHYPNNMQCKDRLGFKQSWEPIFFYRRRGCKRLIMQSTDEWGAELNDFDCYQCCVPSSNMNGADAKVHSAQKPLTVMRWLVHAVTVPGDMVCDPFCGSGTTGIAAVQLKRRFHGIETDGGFCKLAERRIAAYGMEH